MEIIIKDVNKDINKYDKFIIEFKGKIKELGEIPSDQIKKYKLQESVYDFFPKNKPLYTVRPYKFIRSYIFIEEMTYDCTKEYKLTGYDIYTNDNYEVIMICSTDGKEIECNYGYVSDVHNTMGTLGEAFVKEYIFSDETLRKDFIKRDYKLKEVNEINLSYEEWLEVYENIPDESTRNKILSYLYTKGVLDMDAYETFYIKEGN